jgi:putative ABC transport system ATP-binding protein
MKMTDNIILSCKGLTKVYGLGNELVHAVDGVDLAFEQGKFYALVGPSGSGKTTLLNLLSLLDYPDSGTITVGGTTLQPKSPREKIRKDNISVVFQEFHLIPTLSLRENVQVPLYFHKGNHNGRVDELLKLLGIADRAQHKPRELSGGEKQRTAIARSLVVQPKLLFADEPTGNLDSCNSERIYEIFRNLVNSLGLTIVVVTHNEKMAQNADGVWTMTDGKITGGSGVCA